MKFVTSTYNFSSKTNSLTKTFQVFYSYTGLFYQEKEQSSLIGTKLQDP